MRYKTNKTTQERDAWPIYAEVLCVEALRAARSYRKVQPEAFQIWANSERKGAASLALKILKAMKRANAAHKPSGDNPRLGCNEL